MHRMILPIAAAISAAVIATSVAWAGGYGGSHTGHDMPGMQHGSPSRLAKEMARARGALKPYATDLQAAQTTGGYKLQITPFMAGMGFHYMNPDIKDFDVTRPPILVYVGKGADAQLVAAEWVFPKRPAKPPL